MFRFTDYIDASYIGQNPIRINVRQDLLNHVNEIFAETPDAVIEIINESQDRICYCIQDTKESLANSQLKALSDVMEKHLLRLIPENKTLYLQDAGEMNGTLWHLFKKNNRKVACTGAWWECFAVQTERMILPPSERIIVEEHDVNWLHQVFMQCCMEEENVDSPSILQCMPYNEVQDGRIYYEKLFQKMNDEQLGELFHQLAKIQGKKLAAVYGNCHFEVISRYLCHAPAFRKNYLLVLIPPVFDMEKYGITTLSRTFLRYLDLLIYQNIMKENLYGQQWSTDEIKCRLTKECKTICVPNTVFFGYFPQEGRRHNTILKNRVNFVPMFCGDKYIDQTFADTVDISATIKFLSQDDAIPEKDIIINMKKSLRMLEFQDLGCDIPMKDFVEENYQKYYQGLILF